jgi:phosphate-selective porin
MNPLAHTFGSLLVVLATTSVAYAQTDTAPPAPVSPAAPTAPPAATVPPAAPTPPAASTSPSDSSLPTSPPPNEPAPGAAPPPPPIEPTGYSPIPAWPSPAPGDPLAAYPLASYHGGAFYIRSPDDFFRLYIMGRVHSDWIDQLGPGTSNVPPGSNINNGFFLRRARLELAGEFYQTWQWQVGAEFSSSTSIDNAAATQTTPTCTPNPATGALPCTDKENPVSNATVKPIPTDVFVNFGPLPWTNLQVGQFYLPFTLENRISDNTTPFLERSIPVRNWGAPLQRDIGAMFWGESPDHLLYYAVAFLNGDGPNRVNVDTRYEVSGRVVLRPFATSTNSPTKWAQIGFSARQSSADPTRVGYDLPSLSTQDGYVFWKPTYTDSNGRLIHIMPSTGQWGLAGDIYLPIENFDVTGEFIYAVDNTREAVDGYQLSNFTQRLGSLKGYGWYAQAGYWIIGDHDIIGYPSYGRPIHVDLTAPQRKHTQGLQALVKFEQLRLDYDGNARGGTLDSKTPNGEINVDTVEFGISYWATKHLRFGFNYDLNIFPDSAPVSPTTTGGPQQGPQQRAVAPAQLLAKGTDDSARDSGHTLNEFSVRVGVQF